MKCLFPISKGELSRVLLHIPLGLLVCLLCYVHWALALAFVISFLYYELNQDMHLSDEAFKDIKGFLYGMMIGGVIMLTLKLGGVL